MPAISVIVPVYNVEEYLALCLSSIRKQTLRDIEIVCVNDGSTDFSRDILTLAAQVDSRIRVIDKANGGLSSARNAGIDAATGDIIMFVDSDDWLDKRACRAVKDVFDQHDPDMATFSARIFPRSAVLPWLRHVLTPKPEVFEGQHIDLPFVKGASPFVWRTAVKRSFLNDNHLRFDEDVAFGEDQVFHFQAYPLSQKTVLSKKRIYFYRASRPGSLMSDRNEDLAGKLSEHQLIARRILQTWQDQGWLNSLRDTMATWIADFLVVDTLAHKSIIRRTLRDGLANLIDDFFGSSMALLPEGTRRLFDSVLTSSPDMRTCYPALSRYELAQNGLVKGSLLLARKALSKALGPVKGITRQILPPPAHHVQRYVESIIDLNEDACMRIMYQQMLQAEVQTATTNLAA